MFCKNCGTENSEGSLYCSNDGVMLTKASERVHLFHEREKFCAHCGQENIVGGNYCISCGHSFEKAVEKSEEKLSVSHVASAVSSTKGRGHVKSGNGLIASLTDVSTYIHSAKFIGISIATLFIISLIISSGMNFVAREAISAELGPFGNLVGDIKLVSFTDVLMAFHLAGLNFTINLMVFEGFIQTSSGLFLILFIPAVVFIIMGYFMHRRDSESSMAERLTRCLTFSIPYALLFGFLSLFAGTSFEMQDQSGFIEGALSVNSDYSFFESVFNAFVISTIFTSIGAMIRLPKEHRLFNYQYGLSISRAILHTIIGLSVAMVVGIFVISSSESVPNEEGANIILGSQVGGYMWNVSQFETLTFEAGAYDEEVTASYSLLGGVKASMDEDELKEDLSGIATGPWILVLVVFGLHFWAGKQLLKASQGNILYEIGAYAIAFGLVNTVIVGITNLSASINLDEDIAFSLGFSSIGVFFISTILAFVVSYGSVMVLGRQTSSTQAQSYSA